MMGTAPIGTRLEKELTVVRKKEKNCIVVLVGGERDGREGGGESCPHSVPGGSRNFDTYRS